MSPALSDRRTDRTERMLRTDALVIGSGAAGLLLALHCAEKGMRVTVVTKGTIEESNTAWAQGGVAATLDLEEDSPAAHVADTLAAGAGLCNVAAAEIVAEEAPKRIEELRDLGVAFNLSVTGELALTREAAHSHARTVFSQDATGRAISTTLAQKALNHSNVTVVERASAVSLIMDGERCAGAWIFAKGELVPILAAAATALATGGVGQVYERTTNPPGATGDGLALASDAGAALADVEFVQFHPTALAVAGAPALLVSEAARGEGGILVNKEGRRFCFDADPRGELAPRDVVARAIFREMQRTHGGVWLDLRPIGSPDFLRKRFPNIAAACARFGVDITTQPIPVGPAAHYHMGGVLTDLFGRTTLRALYAVGECACTGLHGANRLAGNSLAECLVFGARAADDIGAATRVEEPRDLSPIANRLEAMMTVEPLRKLMWKDASVERDGKRLVALREKLAEWRLATVPLSRSSLESRALLCAARYIAGAALVREESRGAHDRTDFPDRDDVHWLGRIVWLREQYELEPLTAPAVS
ncbi:MAG TPA: L-aspartate oxidase [Candidatus Acidoferrales bacterium]|nr:L-aspartate oxidase [Candidatus Acidoferrales bacterium]